MYQNYTHHVKVIIQTNHTSSQVTFNDLSFVLLLNAKLLYDLNLKPDLLWTDIKCSHY